MTWFIDVIQVAPLAVITAPEKRCGKSLLLSLFGQLVARPITASNISPAALFRSIDAWNPTLLIDEADAFMKDNEELRGLLNSGHTRDSAYVIRIVGEKFTPTKFNTWGAKALAGIGHVADTLMDRAVILELRRKLPHEKN
jgi:putative DNA primase/helicase